MQEINHQNSWQYIYSSLGLKTKILAQHGIWHRSTDKFLWPKTSTKSFCLVFFVVFCLNYFTFLYAILYMLVMHGMLITRKYTETVGIWFLLVNSQKKIIQQQL